MAHGADDPAAGDPRSSVTRSEQPAATTSLDERYGRRPAGARRTRVLVAVAAAALLALGVGWAAWVSQSVANRPLTWQDVGFQVVGDTVTRVTFDVRFAGDLPDGASAVCTLRALNAVSAEVGLRDVTVGPASRELVRTTADVATSERAVTGMVKDCAVADR
jgi:uncharacterized protein DUF4307